MENEKNINEEVVEEILEEVQEETVIDDKIIEEVIEDVIEEVESLEEKLQKENAILKDKAIRAVAEFDNFRKRTAKEKMTIYSDGVKDTVEKLLPIIDNFDRAMSATGVDDKDNFYIGMDMIYKQFKALLDDLGVKELGQIGDEFDPTYHFAVAKEDNEELGENVISEILQKGYILNDKVIRPTMVKVAN